MSKRLSVWIALAATSICLSNTSPALAAKIEAKSNRPVAQSRDFVALAVFPAQVALNHGHDFQRVVAVATRSDGVTSDVTDDVEWTVAPTDGSTAVATLKGNSVMPMVNGTARLEATFGALSANAIIQTQNVEKVRPISFRQDVVPVFMRTGCNAGGCHGASSGKDGFRLSLFGFDPAGDYKRLTRELATRRINLALPEESLLLMKAAGDVPHTGGKRFDKDSDYYQAIEHWLDAGAPSDVENAPSVTGLAIYPPRAVLEGEGAAQRFVAVAHYSDDTTRDVTDLAIFRSNNSSSAAINELGQAVAGTRGEAFVMARFDTHTVGSQVLTLPKDAKYEPLNEQPANYIDELVNAKLATLRITPSALCTDDEFLRRVTIDVTGRLPTQDDLTVFREDKSSKKRAHKIDELLERKEFSEIWAMKWAELLMVRTEPNRVEYKPMFLYWQWLNKQIADGVPIDQMVRNLLSASGGSFAEPAVNFYQIEPTPQKIAENVAQAFLGIRVQCAQCHNHPFDRWTMDDYYAFTAFFSQIGRKRGEDYREQIVFDRRGGEVKHPVTGRQMAPKFLGGPEPDVKGRDRRAVVAEWITSPDNPYFAINVANRVWAHFFGVGIVEPVDDVRVSNPPSNPELFATLGAKLVEYDYELKQLVRDICNSKAYQRSTDASESNRDDARNFARAHMRRIPAEMLLDCICQATETPEKFPGLPLGARASQIADGRAGNYFLTTFGRARRDTVCTCEVKTDPTLSQALHLLNGNTVHGKVVKGKLIERWIDEGKSPAEIIDELFLRCLSRSPTDEERAQLLTLFGDDPRPVPELQDAFWAVLNSREFLFNH